MYTLSAEDDSIEMKRYITFQLQEIYEHGYYENIKARKDIGIEGACLAWVQHKYSDIGDRTHAERFSEDYKSNVEDITDVCNGLCGDNNCEGIEQCLLTLPIIHKLLRD